MTGTLTITRGLPTSGKSTAAKLLVAQDPANRARVSRDDIRSMLYGYPEVPIDFSREDEVTAIEEAAVRAGLKAGKDVLVDATHLRAKYIRKWNDLHPLTEVIDFEVDVDEAVRRDSLRMYPVGEAVIRDMAQRFLVKGKLPPLPDLSRRQPTEVRQVEPWSHLKTDAIILDIDGSIAHMTDRGPYDTSRYHTDEVDEYVLSVIQVLSNEFPILVTTGRSEDFREVTHKWLIDNNVPFDSLIMRKSGDARNDAIIKPELYWEFIAPEYNVVMAFDDRDRVVRAWRDMGIKVAQIAYGNF